ncbi:MAG: hypothetical protein RXR32_03320, partial [Candidatus Micrarchaeota archaeon]
VAYLCNSSLSKDQLLECAEKVKEQDEHEFVQLFRNKKGIAEKLLPAYFNALIRQRDALMRSSSIAIETLLFVSGSMNIAKAINEFGINDASEFILFATSKKVAGSFIKCSKSKIIKELKLSLANRQSPRIAVSELLSG